MNDRLDQDLRRAYELFGQDHDRLRADLMASLSPDAASVDLAPETQRRWRQETESTMIDAKTKRGPESEGREASQRDSRTLRVRMFFFGVLLLSTLLLWTAPLVFQRKYEASVRFQRRADQVSSPADAAEAAADIRLRLDHELLGRAALKVVIDEVGLARALPREDGELTPEARRMKDDLLGELKANLSLRQLIESPNLDLYQLSFVHSDPRLACEILNALMRNYTGRLYDRIKNELVHAREFLHRQVERAEKRHDKLSEERVEFLTKRGRIPADPAELPGRIKQTEANLEDLRLEKTNAEMKLAQLRVVKRGSTAPSIRSSKATKEPAHQTPREMEIAVAKLKLRTVDKKVKQLGARLRSLEELLRNFTSISKEHRRIKKNLRMAAHELEGYQDEFLVVGKKLAAEAARCRTHLDTLEVAEPGAPPVSPTLGWLLLVILCAGGVLGIILAIWPIRLRLTGRIVVTVLLLVLLLAAGVGALGVTLWLHYPDQYEQFTADRIGYLVDWVPKLIEAIGGEDGEWMMQQLYPGTYRRH